MRKRLVFLGVGLLPWAWGLPIQPVEENRHVTVHIACDDKTRIAVLGDRIARVQGTEGAYRSRWDAVNGEFYVVPTLDYQHKPFTVFVATEKGHHYGLRLIPEERSAESVVLKPRPDVITAREGEKASDYETLIVQLMEAMVQERALEGYRVHTGKRTEKTGKKKKTPSLWGEKKIKVRLQSVYQGASLTGEIWTVQNGSSQEKRLSEMRWDRSDIGAMAFETERLPPHARTRLYVVRSIRSFF